MSRYAARSVTPGRSSPRPRSGRTDHHPGWTTRDLAAHLVVRERRPDTRRPAAPRRCAGHTERVRRAAAARPYPELVELVRRRPRWGPLSLPPVDELANLAEFFIHHEDVRRARDRLAARGSFRRPARARSGNGSPAWPGWSLRRFPAAVLVQAPHHGEVAVGTGGPQVRLVGPPAELVMFLFGRQRVARVRLRGPTALTERLQTMRLGI